MDINDLRTIFTMLVVIAFIGIVVWAYSSKRKESFDATVKAALDDGDDAPVRDNNAGQQ